MDLSKSLQQYFDDLSSNAPTPGGGNVAALCGALSSSLGAMVCGLTIGKKKYAEVESEMIEVKAKLDSYQKEFFALGQKDNAAFDKVMEAFKLPKETEAEKEARSKAIESATFGAAAVPEEVMKKAKEILPFLKTIIEKGNKNSLSDAGVAAALVAAASKGAYLNVLINCSSLSNQTIAQEIKKRSDIVLDETCAESNRLLENVFTSIQPK
ncbi:MAG: cyclodeaminase/cyclohydrolase family protein [Bacteroidota bacterium]